MFVRIKEGVINSKGHRVPQYLWNKEFEVIEIKDGIYTLKYGQHHTHKIKEEYIIMPSLD